MLTLIVTLGSPVGSAQAVDYPSWDDLQSAKANTSAAAAQVDEIKALIANLQSRVAETAAAAEARGAELQVAQDKFDDATRRARDLQEQADAGAATADAATRQAGQLAAQLYRTGGTDLSVNLILDGKASGQGADALLSKLGSMSKLVERSTGIYEEAQTTENTARSLGDQAKVAQVEREKLRIAAEGALVAAQAAADVAAAALAESEAKSLELAQQLKYMQDTEATTTDGYEAGVRERERLAKEAAAKAAAEAAEAAAAAARQQSSSSASGGGGGSWGGGGGLGGGFISSEGWAVPAGGRITDVYGPRSVICGSDGCSGGFHYATDLGAGCGSAIYAAHSGTVEYAGRLGTYGNYIQIDNGNGISTGYAHIRDGGTFVGYGERVEAGENIGSVGMTGAADGCHLHFEVRTNGDRIDPTPFMADRGASLG